MNRSSFNSFLRTNTYFITKNNSSCMHIFNIKSERRLFNQAQVKPVGVLPHRKRSKLRENSTFKLMPSKLALMAVQRQTAASSSAAPPGRCSKEWWEGRLSAFPSILLIIWRRCLVLRHQLVKLPIDHQQSAVAELMVKGCRRLLKQSREGSLQEK